jgi:hypothetical protein
LFKENRSTMIRHDLCLAWNWEYDADFVTLLEAACLERRLSLWPVTPSTLAASLEILASGESSFRTFLDRASEADPRFIPLVEWAVGNGIAEINPHHQSLRAVNKASMHLEFISAGIQAPQTIILPPYSLQPDVSSVDLTPLGENFIVKPAHGGGGEGVVLEVSTLGRVLEARQAHPHDHYLLQAHIAPVCLAGRPAWFRVLYCDGRIYPFWWDTTTHIYQAVSDVEVELFGLSPLVSTTRTIAQVCGLDLFSTEIALTAAGLFVVVDYVNNPIDLRLQSAAADGVPDESVRDIAFRLADFALRQRSSVTL